jgi:hypothetical protein
MFRFDAKQAYYLYPEADGAEDLELILNHGSSFEKNVVPRDDIQVIKHGLRIPKDVDNYSQFVNAIKVSEEEFIRNLIV